MGFRVITLKEQAAMPLVKLEKRTYLDAQGKVTDDEEAAFSLLGAEGDEITEERAYEVGLRKTEPKAEEGPAVERVYYNAEGKRVKESDPGATRMFLSDDPLRPDSDESKATAAETERLQAAQAEGQQVGVMVKDQAQLDAEAAEAKPARYEDMKKADLVELAESRGLEPEGGQNREHYIAALQAADEKA